MNPRNLQPSNTFYFNAKFVRKIAKGFKANPVDFDRTSNPMNMNVNAVHYGKPQPANYNHTNPNPCSFPNPSNSNPRSNFNSNNSTTPLSPCSLCRYKGFDEIHYTLNEQCGVSKLSSAEIIKILNITRSCPTCGRVHFTDRPCKTVIQGKSRICTKSANTMATPSTTQHVNTMTKPRLAPFQ